jgi:LysR family transcriptional regulator of abg operon
MKLTQFRNVLAIAERGSLRAAARSLQFAQPALTRSLQEIEHELGAPLFERRSRGMTLTPLGQAFVRRANGILEEVRRIREEAEQIRGGSVGNVSVGLSIAAHMALLPQALGVFRKRYPAVDVSIVEGFYPTVETPLLNGSMDFYIGPEADPGPATELQQIILTDNDRVVLARKGHPLRKSRSLVELKDAEWATTTVTQSAGDELSTLFGRYKLGKPRLAVRTQSALSLLVAIGYSDLLAMVPIQWTRFEMMSNILQPIYVREKLPAPRLVMVRRAALPLTPAAEHFAQLLVGELDADVSTSA